MLKNLNYLYILILLLISFIANFYYGSVGVFPIDTFAFFDSANLINHGFFPIRDYWTSNGFLVDFLQSVFFRTFGTSWYVYLLHSSLVNFLLVFFTYKFLINEGLSLRASLLYSLSVGILAYPPVGVPFPDHHSLIFSILSIYSLIFSFQKNSYLFLFFTILFLAIAFLCKQVPAAFFIILVSFYLIYFSIKKKNYNFILYSLVFASSLLLIFLSFLIINNIGIKDFLIQYISFPLSIGSERTEGLKISNFAISLVNEFKFF
ncbi:glycosyltransferase family 39 protein, partial [Pelagibacteraceae bacterium]|nr:glycosyltransferase family 39 protein [Pelagibacteraceae bacterium]